MTIHSDPRTTSPTRKRRWYQFSLRTLLVVMLLASVGLSWCAVKMQQARRQRAAVEALRQANIAVLYEYEETGPDPMVPRGPTCLRQILGDDAFNDVYSVWSNIDGAERVSDRDIEPLCRLNRVKRVSLCYTSVTDDGMKVIGRLGELECLQLIEATKITNAGLAHLKNLTQLQYLDLGHTQVTDAGLVHLQNHPQLEDLALSDTRITDKGLEHLKRLKQLQWLDLSGTEVTDAGEEDLSEALPGCEIFRTRM